MSRNIDYDEWGEDSDELLDEPIIYKVDPKIEFFSLYPFAEDLVRVEEMEFKIVDDPNASHRIDLYGTVNSDNRRSFSGLISWFPRDGDSYFISSTERIGQSIRKSRAELRRELDGLKTSFGPEIFNKLLSYFQLTKDSEEPILNQHENLTAENQRPALIPVKQENSGPSKRMLETDGRTYITFDGLTRSIKDRDKIRVKISGIRGAAKNTLISMWQVPADPTSFACEPDDRVEINIRPDYLLLLRNKIVNVLEQIRRIMVIPTSQTPASAGEIVRETIN